MRDQYKSVFGSYPLVTLNDVFFGIHALALTKITMAQVVLKESTQFLTYQVFIYKEAGKRIVISSWNSYLMTGLLFGGGILAIDSLVGHAWTLDVLYYLSGVKMTITVIKYLPQVVVYRIARF